MISDAEPFHIPVRRYGAIARRLLRDGAEGRVAAVFRRSFYLESGDECLCIGTEALDLGPLNAVTGASRETDWSAGGIRPGLGWHASAEKLRVGPLHVFGLAGVQVWTPRALGAWRPGDMRRSLAALVRAAGKRVPEEGLGTVVIPNARRPSDDLVQRAARASVSGLRGWLVSELKEPGGARPDPRPWARRLVGLGPGLTPSGDDFLGGIMIALHGIGRREVARQLWTAIGPSANEAGNRISAAHLAAAADGQGHEVVHDLLRALFMGCAGTFGARLAAIDGIGHTSGWDALAGVITALEATLEACDVRRDVAANCRPIAAGP